jgi:hypothetical protein
VTAPLDDPTYTPVHRPADGRVPDVVARWGPKSQLRWFRRFRNQLAHGQWLDRFYCETEHHCGPCCNSCFDEFQDGYGVMLDGWCCCQAVRSLYPGVSALP